MGAAEAAGRLLMQSLGRLRAGQVARKGASDYVTAVDRAAERLILQRIRARFPAHRIVAEESGRSARSTASAYEWFVDPIDGTTNYIHQFPAFCVSIGLACEGCMVLGVVYDPWRDELFHGARGGGAFCNRRRIHVAARRHLCDGLIATGFPVRIQRRLTAYLTSFRQVFLHSSGIRRAGSAALDLAYTACGRVDGFWEMGLSPWDIAAGTLLVEEAGGRVSDFAGGDGYLAHGSVLVANPALHAQLVRLLRPIFPTGH
ncbi:MAG: inositol monophosphatase [Candidatus Omnitrophica bacterium]|nr:inositol monophosphatase [Candidatus Omnitrophota bacterium]